MNDDTVLSCGDTLDVGSPAEAPREDAGRKQRLARLAVPGPTRVFTLSVLDWGHKYPSEYGARSVSLDGAPREVHMTVSLPYVSSSKRTKKARENELFDHSSHST